MIKPIREETVEQPFAMQVADNPRVKGVYSGLEAMKKSGAQPEFVAANMMQASAMNCTVILRAGEPPQYDKKRSSKSGVNLSKTSKVGLFKGAIPQEERFGRVDEQGIPLPQNNYDKEHLKLPPTSLDYQHCMQLDINIHDILRELGPEGDLKVSGFDATTGLLRLEYRDGHGPQKNIFDGQFVIDLSKGVESPQFLSRDWNRPENHAQWDKERKIIKKPESLRDVPDEIYQQIFHQTFKAGYTEEKGPVVDPETIKQAKVFANRPRNSDKFLAAMGDNHRHYELVKNCQNLSSILNTLKQELPEAEANATILEVYDRHGTIVAGDWDGMALGHPPFLNAKYTEVINVFAPGEDGRKNREKLIEHCDEYFEEIRNAAQDKQNNNVPLTSFEEKILSINFFSSIVSEFALERAGCITAHEFLFQQVLNDAYRDKNNAHYGEKYDMDVLQKSMNTLLYQTERIPDLHDFAKETIKKDMDKAGIHLSEVMLNKLTEHLVTHFKTAKHNGEAHYVLPHLQHDMNVHDLYQHGFDMRNPYGCNLAGAWLLITDSAIFYGETQEQLIEVMLTGDLLEKNCIDVNHGADFSCGWDKIIERQLQLGQNILPKTLNSYYEYKRTISRKDSGIGSEIGDSPSGSSSSLNSVSEYKKELAAFKASNIVEPEPDAVPKASI